MGEQPTVGRIVHAVTQNGCRAAIVIDVDGEVPWLQLFTRPEEGVETIRTWPYTALRGTGGIGLGSWHWPREH